MATLKTVAIARFLPAMFDRGDFGPRRLSSLSEFLEPKIKPKESHQLRSKGGGRGVISLGLLAADRWAKSKFFAAKLAKLFF